MFELVFCFVQESERGLLLCCAHWVEKCINHGEITLTTGPPLELSALTELCRALDIS